MDWFFSLLLPFSYLAILIASLGTFSHLYRRRQTLRTARLEPWFGPHTTRQIYLTLLEQASADKGAKIPDSVLRAALLRRAVTDIRRLLELRGAKQPLASLLQRGAVGDELMQRFQLAEKEMEAELKDVVQEANALSGPSPGTPGAWGQTIFASAGEMAHTEMLSARLDGLDAERAGIRDTWEARKAEVRDDFMKELDADDSTKRSDDDAVLVDGGVPDSPQGKKKKAKK